MADIPDMQLQTYCKTELALQKGFLEKAFYGRNILFNYLQSDHLRIFILQNKLYHKLILLNYSLISKKQDKA